MTVGVLSICGLCASVMLLGPGKRRAVTLALTVILAPALLLIHLGAIDLVASLLNLGVGGLILIGAAPLVTIVSVGILLRWPRVGIWLTVLVLPLRLPIAIGDTSANLLLPLYGVIGAVAIAQIVRDWRMANVPNKSTLDPVTVSLAIFIGFYGIQSLYSVDPDKALEQLLFFYVPFALLFTALKSLELDHRTLIGSAGVLIGSALLLSAIGLWEYHTRELLLNPKVINSNAFEDYFRVNSIFFDPNMFGRYLVVAITILIAAIMNQRSARRMAVMIPTVAILWLGLLVTLSQSSFIALLCGLAVLATAYLPLQRAVTIFGSTILVGGLLIALYPSIFGLDRGHLRTSIDRATSGRFALISGGLDLVHKRPLLGWGSGGFERAYRSEEIHSKVSSVAASHTTPITIAAEQGAIGLLAYLAIIWTTLRYWRRSNQNSVSIALGAVYIALIVHSLGYAAFLEDPVVWVVLALAAITAKGSSLRAAETPNSLTRTPATPDPVAL